MPDLPKNPCCLSVLQVVGTLPSPYVSACPHDVIYAPSATQHRMHKNVIRARRKNIDTGRALDKNRLHKD
jgi:hypothetical protein